MGLYHERSIAYSNLTKYDEALEDLDTALSIDDNSPENISMKAKCLYQRAKNNLNKGSLQKAQQDAQEVLRYMQTKYQMGRQYFKHQMNLNWCR